MVTSRQIDILKEFINIGVGRGASALNTMLKSHIRLYVLSLKIISSVDLKNEIKVLGANKLLSVTMGFGGTVSGNVQLIFSAGSGVKLAKQLIGDEATSADIDTLKEEMLCEVGNVVLNSVMGSFSNLLGLDLELIVPTYYEGDIWLLSQKDTTQPDPVIVLASTEFNIEALNIDGNIGLFFEEDSFNDLIGKIDKYASDMAMEQGGQ